MRFLKCKLNPETDLSILSLLPSRPTSPPPPPRITSLLCTMLKKVLKESQILYFTFVRHKNERQKVNEEIQKALSMILVKPNRLFETQCSLRLVQYITFHGKFSEFCWQWKFAVSQEQKSWMGPAIGFDVFLHEVCAYQLSVTYCELCIVYSPQMWEILSPRQFRATEGCQMVI